MEKHEQLSMIERLNEILGVDKLLDNPLKEPEEKTYKGMKPSKKVKVLVIPVDESFMEGNLIEVPFVSYFKSKEPTTVVEYVWVDSKGNDRKIEVRGSKWGVPDEFCFDVLTALFRLHVKQNQGIQFNLDENKWNMTKEIHFTFSELAREMGYKSLGKNIFDKLDIALEMLNDTNIYNKSCGGFLDVKTNTYITGEIKESIGIIRNYKSYRYAKLKADEKRIDYRQIKDKTSVIIDDFIYESLSNSYFKIFNYQQYSQLRMGIAKKIFLLLNKWRAKRKKVFLKWDTLYQRIPLPLEKGDGTFITEKYRKRRVKDAIKELLGIGYIKEVHENTIGVEFIFEDGVENEALIEGDSTNTDKYNTINDILSTLSALDLAHEEIQSILTHIEIDKIRELLRKTEEMDILKRKKMLIDTIVI